MKVLHIDSSIMADASVSRQLSQAIVSRAYYDYSAYIRICTLYSLYLFFVFSLDKIL